MSERVRLLIHEATDIDRIVREYSAREPIDEDELDEILDDVKTGAIDTARASTRIFDLMESDARDARVNAARVEDLIDRLAEIYESALARGGHATAQTNRR